jgi:uncharacterized metal-binding protein YceD (DUF177 family)
MQINISNLSEGVFLYDLSAESRDLDLGEEFCGIVDAHVTLAKSLNQLLLTVKVSAKGVFVCDRCAEEYEEPLKTTFNSVYSWESGEGAEDDDDFHVLEYDQNMIDISETVKEYLLLAVPLKHLCGKPDCKIPVRKGKSEEAVDPRWEKLKELKKQQST